MFLRAASPWKAPDPGSPHPGGCGLSELVPADTCECSWHVSHDPPCVVEWQRWHDVGSARASIAWRPRKSCRWMNCRSGRSTSFVSIGTIAVLAWQSRQKFCSWQVEHDCCDDRATLACRRKKSPACETCVSGTSGYEVRSTWQVEHFASAYCCACSWHFRHAAWPALTGAGCLGSESCVWQTVQ